MSDVAPLGTHSGHPASLRALVHRHLEATHATTGRLSITNLVLLLLILANIVALVTESIPGTAAYASFFHWFEAVSVVLFTIEYIGRVWACAEDPRFSDGARGRLAYMRTPLAIVDLLAILPFYLPARVLDLRSLRVLRLFRLLRIGKLARYSAALHILGSVMKEKRAELTLVLSFLAVLVLCSGSVMYFAERHAQPDVFSSIPAAAWWSIVTLTTIGYGDAVPMTPIGRVIGSFVAVFGIGLFALPAGLLAAAFTEALAQRRGADGVCPHCGRSGSSQAMAQSQRGFSERE